MQTNLALGIWSKGQISTQFIKKNTFIQDRPIPISKINKYSLNYWLQFLE